MNSAHMKPFCDLSRRAFIRAHVQSHQNRAASQSAVAMVYPICKFVSIAQRMCYEMQVQIPKESTRRPTDREMVRMLQREIAELRAQVASQNRQAGESPQEPLDAESAPGASDHFHDMAESSTQEMELSVETASDGEPSEGLQLHTPAQKVEARSWGKRDLEMTPAKNGVSSNGADAHGEEQESEEISEEGSGRSEGATSAGGSDARVSKLGRQLRELGSLDLDSVADVYLLDLINSLIQVRCMWLASPKQTLSASKSETDISAEDVMDYSGLGV